MGSACTSTVIIIKLLNYSARNGCCPAKTLTFLTGQGKKYKQEYYDNLIHAGKSVIPAAMMVHKLFISLMPKYNKFYT